MKFLSFVLLLVLTVSCIKTAEQVNREKRVESMSEQMKDSQGLVADMMTQMKDLQSQIDKMNGRMEELEHNQKKLDPEAINKMSENMAIVKTQQDTQSAQLVQIQNELKEQRTFIEKVTSNLSQASSSKSQKKKRKK